jgi:formate dehydrogenase subunit gamma
MNSALRPFRLLLAAWLFAVLAAGSSTALAQAASAPNAGPPAGFVAPLEPKPDETNAQRGKSQPGNNAPFWRGVRESGSQEGYTSLPGAEKGVLIQKFVQYPGSRFTSAGEAWREVRNRWIIPYGGSLLLIVLVAIGLFYWRRGSIGHDNNTGRKIERFTPFERAAHWTNAAAFVVLAVSGIVMAFGKFFLLPVLGATLFGWLTYALKTAHNFAGPLFAVSLTVIFFTFVRDNLPRREDIAWLRKAGGLFGGEEVPSHRFNAGEKIVFWAGVRRGRRLGARARQADPGPGRDAKRHADRPHDPCLRGRADDGAVLRPHLSGHDRHARRIPRHANRLRRRKLGARAPRAVA